MIRRGWGGGALRRLGMGGAIALVAAILLFFLMFRQWYGVGFTTESNLLGYLNLFPRDHDAWHALGVIPIVLLLVAIAIAVGAAVVALAGSDRKPVVPLGATVCVSGGLAALVVLHQIIWPPDLGGELEGWTWAATLKLPIFLALAAALGIALGGWLTMRDEGASFARIAKRLGSRDRSPRPAKAP